MLTYANKRTAGSFFEQRSAELGEHWESRFSDEEIMELINGLGFSECVIPDAATIESYFRDRTDRLTAPKLNTLIAAIV